MAAAFLQMSSDYRRWQVSLLLSWLPFTPLGKHAAGVTSSKGVYMVDLPQTSPVTSYVGALLHIFSLSLSLCWNLTSSFGSDFGNCVTFGELTVKPFYCLVHHTQCLTLFIPLLESKVWENYIWFLLLRFYQYLKLLIFSELISHWLENSLFQLLCSEGEQVQKRKALLIFLTVESRGSRAFSSNTSPMLFPT